MLLIGTVGFASSSVAVGEETQKVRERSEIETQYLWKTDAIFPNDEAWDAEFGAVAAMIPDIVKFKGTLNKGSERLLAFFAMQEKLEPRIDRLHVYASLLSDQDTRVGKYQGLKSRIRSLYIDYGAQMSWVTPELTSIPYETIKSWMKDNEKLAVYAQFFDDTFRQKKHVLSEREEELLAWTGEIRGTPGQAYNLLSNADMKYGKIKDEKGDEVELDDSAFYIFMRSGDRRVRKDAYETIVGAYAQYRNTAAALLNGEVQSHLFTVKARSYDSCLAAALDGSNVPIAVYNTLVSSINENLPLMHRYQAIRKKALKLDDGVHAYDLFAPLMTGQKYEVEYEDSVERILTALAPLGKDYIANMRRGFDSRWVDVYPTKGKRSGAYSSGTYLTQPYILLNYHGGYESMSTLAHEMGHSMHSFFSRGTQPYVYSDYDIFCAEVASVTNELLLQDYVLKHTDDPKMKLQLLVELLEGIRGTLFRQTMFSEFEQKIHEMAEQGQPLTADTMSATYGEIMRKYYGPDYTHDALVDSYWIRIPHFYYNFYVYKYATSYCAASNISRRILAGEDGAVAAYLAFLNAGSSEYPIDLLKKARVDMTTPQPMNDAMAIFKRYLDQTEALLKELGRM